MTFTLSLLLLTAFAALLLGLVAYHLASRLSTLEEAVQGGLVPPSRRLSRTEFEHRFRVAGTRASLARRFEHGLVLVVDASSGTSQELIDALCHLPRYDDMVVLTPSRDVAETLQRHGVPVVPSTDADLDLSDLGVSTLPFCFVLDEAKVRSTRPLSSYEDFLELLGSTT